MPRLEFCRLCCEFKPSFVNIFETMVFRDGCRLADKLNGLYGIEVSPDGELSKFICVDCLSQIKSLGNMTYNLWSTLDYLIRMWNETEVDVTSYDIPKDSLDFLFPVKKESGSSLAVGSKKNDLMECMSDNSEEEQLRVEFCWCSECNAEFLNHKELIRHSEKHRNNATMVDETKNKDSSFSREEYKLMSGEVSLLKSRLCCGRCQHEFKNEKRLVKHIEKYDFKCKPRRFINLNNCLKDLKNSRAEDNALKDTLAKDSRVQINSKCKCSELLSPNLVMDTKCEMNGILSKCEGSSGSLDETVNRYRRATVGDSYPKSKRSNVSPFLSSCVGSHLATVKSRREALRDEIKPLVGSNEVRYSEQMPAQSVNTTPEIVICNYCTKPYSLKSQLREHIVICHLLIVSHKCSICYRVFPSECELKTHRAKHCSDKKYICSVCDENFDCRSKVVKHSNDLHNISDGRLCRTCFLYYPSNAEFGVHQRHHSSDKKYKCSKCEKSFTKNYSLKKHVRLCQHEDRQYECEQCGKSFVYPSGLRKHSRSHGSIEKYSCHLCPKQYV